MNSITTNTSRKSKHDDLLFGGADYKGLQGNKEDLTTGTATPQAPEPLTATKTQEQRAAERDRDVRHKIIHTALPGNLVTHDLSRESETATEFKMRVLSRSVQIPTDRLETLVKDASVWDALHHKEVKIPFKGEPLVFSAPPHFCSSLLQAVSACSADAPTRFFALLDAQSQMALICSGKNEDQARLRDFVASLGPTERDAVLNRVGRLIEKRPPRNGAELEALNSFLDLLRDTHDRVPFDAADATALTAMKKQLEVLRDANRGQFQPGSALADNGALQLDEYRAAHDILGTVASFELKKGDPTESRKEFARLMETWCRAAPDAAKVLQGFRELEHKIKPESATARFVETGLAEAAEGAGRTGDDAGQRRLLGMLIGIARKKTITGGKHGLSGDMARTVFPIVMQLAERHGNNAAMLAHAINETGIGLQPKTMRQFFKDLLKHCTHPDNTPAESEFISTIHTLITKQGAPAPIIQARPVDRY